MLERGSLDKFEMLIFVPNIFLCIRKDKPGQATRKLSEEIASELN